MTRRDHPERLPALALMLAAVLSFYLALQVDQTGPRLLLVAKGAALMTAAAVMCRCVRHAAIRVTRRTGR